MQIKLSPIRQDAELSIVRQGDMLTINGQALDFSPLLDGATLPAEAIHCEWINHPVERIDGKLVLTITMPHGGEAGKASRFPADILNPPDGRVHLPTDDDPKPEAEEAVQ